jgi:hypothetical protein
MPPPTSDSAALAGARSEPSEPRSPAWAHPAFAIVALAALAIVAAASAAGYRKAPGLGGLLSGLGGGLLLALLFCGACALAILAFWSPKSRAAGDTPEAAALEKKLGPTLAELEAVRIDTVAKVKRRALWTVPLGICGGIAFWMIPDKEHHGARLFELAEYCGFGIVGGYVWASHSLAQAYRRLYKARVLPQLAAQFGALDYRPAELPDLDLLRADRIFCAFDRSVAEDEIFGHYRGLTLSIVELTLTQGSGKNRRTVFDGLVTRIALPRRLSGTTAIVADGGLFDDFRDLWTGKGGERVRVEDPRFEALYEVYGTDQIAARALLTPAFMERFLTLGERSGFGRPAALARDNGLLIVLPKQGHANLFEPPAYWRSAASEDALIKLYHDIEGVLRAADAVIDLDQASRAQAAPSAIGVSHP